MATKSKVSFSGRQNGAGTYIDLAFSNGTTRTFLLTADHPLSITSPLMVSARKFATRSARLQVSKKLSSKSMPCLPPLKRANGTFSAIARVCLLSASLPRHFPASTTRVLTMHRRSCPSCRKNSKQTCGKRPAWRWKLPS